MQITIDEATDANQIGAVKRLIIDYALWLADDHGISLKFQNIDEELACLPGKYAPPAGALRLATGADGMALGCIALRPFTEETGEIKRLFVAPAARGSGLGSRLISDLVTCARDIGYRRLVLDTGEFMGPAQRLYEAHGFKNIPAYSPAPPGVKIRHFGRDLE